MDGKWWIYECTDGAYDIYHFSIEMRVMQRFPVTLLQHPTHPPLFVSFALSQRTLAHKPRAHPQQISHSFIHRPSIAPLILDMSSHLAHISHTPDMSHLAVMQPRST